jgi:ribosomal protein L37AE/L43A
MAARPDRLDGPMTWVRCEVPLCPDRHCAHPRCGQHVSRPFCDSCEGAVRLALHKLPRLHNALLLLLPTAQQNGEQVSGTRNPPLPAGADAALTAVVIRDLLISWEDTLRDMRVWTRWTAQERTVHTAARWLTRRASYLLESDAAADFGNELLTEQYRALRVLSADQLVHHLPVPCSQCDQRTLIRRDGEGFVRCAACHTTWSEEAYEWLCRIEAQDMPEQPAREHTGPGSVAEGTDTRIGVVTHREAV